MAAVLERRQRPLLAAVLVVLTAITVVLAERKPLWNDELFTYYVSRLPGPGDIWSELESGVEQTPPLFYLVTRASVAVLGDEPLALRAPALLGFALMVVCLFVLVARRSAPVYGFVAVLFSVATLAHGYAYEARAYGLVLGFSAAALLGWQVAAEGGRHRRLAALGTALSLAAAVSVHYYAVLLVLPLLAGEVARSLARRRVDPLVLGSLAGALVPLLVLAPLIRASDDYTGTFWGVPSWSAALRFFPDSLLSLELVAVVAFVVAVVAVAAVRSRDEPEGSAPRRRLPPRHELVALGTLILLPFLGVALGLLVTGAFTTRSVLPALLGMGIALSLGVAWADRRAPVLGVALLLVLTAFAGTRLVARYDEATADADAQARALRFLRQHREAGTPIVVASPHDFFELSHRTAREGGPGLIYLADARRANARLGTDAVELGVVGMQDIAPLRVAPYPGFVASHPRFLVYAGDGAWDWLTPALRDGGAVARVRARDGAGDALWEVRPQRR